MVRKNAHFSGMMSDLRMPTREEDIYLGNKIVTAITPLACHSDPVKCSQMAKNNFMKDLNPHRM